MEPHAELALVRLALTCGTFGCCVWDDRAARRIRGDRAFKDLTPDNILDFLCAFVANKGGEITQREEKRAEYSDRRFWYRVVVPVPVFPHGLFVEMVLDDDDPEVPVVRLVNAHEQRR